MYLCKVEEQRSKGEYKEAWKNRKKSLKANNQREGKELK
jgi:hypothetical protein